MKLAKKTRKLIYEAAAKREAVTIAWPASAPEPLPGHKYAVRGFDPDTRLEVQGRTETGGRWKVEVTLNTDPIRGLRTGAKKAPENPAMGGPQFRAETEPEQVDSRYQKLLDSEGRIKTAMQGNLHRQAQERYRREAEAKREYGKGEGSGARAAQRRADRLPKAA